MKMRTSSSQEEGCEREFSVLTTGFAGEGGKLAGLHYERKGEAFTLQTDLVLLAMGFTGTPAEGIAGAAQVELTPRATIRAETHRSSRDRIFACGDIRRGQSLVVWAIRDGRDCARAVDDYLTGGGVEAPR
jgi:glutamate synthase (NADPH/NADH) small chain